MSLAVGYLNAMENSVGLGPTGTHLFHGAIVGGGVYALGKYADVGWCQNWYAPLAGAGVGVLSSVAIKALVLDDKKSYELFERSAQSSIKANPKWVELGYFDEDGGRFPKMVASTQRSRPAIEEKPKDDAANG